MTRSRIETLVRTQMALDAVLKHWTQKGQRDAHRSLLERCRRDIQDLVASEQKLVEVLHDIMRVE